MWPLQILVLETLTKIVFVPGRLLPIWGRYEFWPVCTLAYFFLDFWDADFGIFKLIASTHRLLSILRFFLKSDLRNSNKVHSKSGTKNAKTDFFWCDRRKYVCTLAHFLNCDSPILEILTWSIVPTVYYRFWEFMQNRYSTIRANFAQSWKKREKSFEACKNF